MNEIPIYDGVSASDAEKALKALFSQIETKQIEFLDEAGKRIIELSTMLLGLLFAVVAFGKDFPPPYLANNLIAQVLVILGLVFYLAALIAGFATVQPRKYTYIRSSLTEMLDTLDRIVDYKQRCFGIGSVLFILGSVCLSVVIGIVIL